MDDASATGPGEPTGAGPPADGSGPEPQARSPLPWVVGGIVLVAAVVALVLVLTLGDDDEVDTGDGTTTSTAAESTTSAGETSTSADSTTTSTTEVVTEPDLQQAVFPDPTTSRRFDDPRAAATAFATDYAGFTEPIVGELREGDARSGEVELRAREDGPVTTVFVRQLGDDGSWFVIGSASENIELDEPQPLGAVDDPLQVSGRSLAFEGVVVVQVRADGRAGPVAQGTVLGGATGELAPFSGEVPFDSPGEGWGEVVLLIMSPRDGSVEEVASVPVGFIGGD